VKRQLEKMLNGDPSRIDPEVPLEYQTCHTIGNGSFQENG
jgi:hypothetical protein